MPVSFRIELESLDDGRVPGLGGEVLHGLIFEILLRGKPAYAKRVHSSPYKPFSLSPLEGARREGGWTIFSAGDDLYFELSFLEDEAVGVFAKGVSREEFRLGGSRVRLSSCELIKGRGFDSLIDDEPSSRALLNFLSPTVLKRKGRELPLPDPEAIISSLLLKWNAFAPKGYRFDAKKERRAKLSRFNIRSSLVRFSTFSTVGFTGVAEFKLPEGDEGKEIWALFRFSEFSGVGNRTAMGLGRVKLGAPAQFEMLTKSPPRAKNYAGGNTPAQTEP